MNQKRTIFEEVSADNKTADKPSPGVIDRAQTRRSGVVGWLLSLFVLVVIIIFVGGLTRLTDSGLSITEWKPVTGAIPPLSAETWSAEFERYKAIPEFLLQNNNMTLAEFKSIYWWEWGHRQLGRLTGLVWAVGFVVLIATRRIPPGWTARLAGIGILGGLQGAIGWWMVTSGLGEGQVDVASYRLAVHLGLAFIILGIIAWYVMALSRSEASLMQARRSADIALRRSANILLVLAFVQVLLGALVAGIDAGRSYTDWPLMAGQFFPAGALDLAPIWRNFFEDAGLVQFMHRMSGYVLLGVGLYVWRISRRSGNSTTKKAFDGLALVLVAQVCVGIATVMMSAPVWVAFFHQLIAVALWVILLRARFLSSYPNTQSIQRT